MSGPAQAATYGSPAWFAQLQGGLRAYVRARVSDPASAEDVLQDALLRVVRGLEQVRDSERLGAWTYAAARSAVIDHYRRQARALPAAELDAVDPAVEDAGGVMPDASRFLASWLLGAIDTLPEPYRATLRATEIDGVPYQVLAEREGLTVSAIKSRVMRGRAKLRAAAERCCEIQQDARGTVIGLKSRRSCGCSG